MSDKSQQSAVEEVPKQDPSLPPVALTEEQHRSDNKHRRVLKIALWVGIGLVGALGWTMLALARGETVNAIWFVFAGVATYYIGYRFYSKFIENKVARPNDLRATPAEYKANGSDYIVTDRRVVYGHHFAAIAGAGPLVGPVLAAHWGFLPGTIWIIVGVIIAGAVQDYLVLYFSMRRGGRSLGQMARDQLGRIGGTAAIIATLVIMIIICAILALVVVNALAESPWGVFSVVVVINSYRSTEIIDTSDPAVPSRTFAPAGLFATKSEKELARRWAKEQPELAKGEVPLVEGKKAGK